MCDCLLSGKRHISAYNLLKSMEKGLSCSRLRLTIAVFEKARGRKTQEEGTCSLLFRCMSVIVTGLNSGEACGHQAESVRGQHATKQSIGSSLMGWGKCLAISRRQQALPPSLGVTRRNVRDAAAGRVVAAVLQPLSRV